MPETNYTESILNAALVKMVPLPTYANIYVGLHDANPTATGSFANEITGSGYGRAYLSLTDEPYSNDTVIEWIVTGPWATVTYLSVSDSSQGGNMLLYNSISTITNPQAGTTIRIPVGNLTIT